MIAFAAGGTTSSAWAQKVLPNSWYSFHTGAVGTCPGIDWNIYVETNGALRGWVAWNRMRNQATTNGTLNPDGSFQLQAQEIAGAKAGTVSGRVSGATLTVSIDGTGSGCDKRTWTMSRHLIIASFANIGGG